MTKEQGEAFKDKEDDFVCELCGGRVADVHECAQCGRSTCDSCCSVVGTSAMDPGVTLCKKCK